MKLFLLGVTILICSLPCQCEHYLNEWAAEIPGGIRTAKRVAKELGYDFRRKINAFDDLYLLSRREVPTMAKRGSEHHTKSLTSHQNVAWAEQQVARPRMKRSINFNDPYWSQQWYIQDTRTYKEQLKQDLHVIPVWEMGYTGKGVVVTVLDDGLEHNNTDIQDNYDPKASWDYNDNDNDPFPRYDATNENKHGTRCAGEIAMVANNNFCGVGVAYNAKIGGIRMLDGKVTDLLESQAIAHASNHVDIYSASWGPNDDGKTMEGPYRLASKAFEKGITQGRGGLGVIYVWASGNGGISGDNCDCDGYTGHPYTISISSASMALKSPWYAEHCASTMATTFSSGSYGQKKIISADLHNQCTNQHSGTSASAPLAAGIFALVLEANPNLTWRDMQHLVAHTSEWAPLKDNTGWHNNAVGYKINNAFGFGLLNAKAIVLAAKEWQRVPESSICETKINVKQNRIPRDVVSQKEYQFSITTDACQGTDKEIRYLEHLQLYISMDYDVRGTLSIDLTSPLGTKTAVLSPRKKDKSSAGMKEWPFMSVHTWGENPKGVWKIVIKDMIGDDNSGQVKDLKLVMRGTAEKPFHYKELPRTYDENYNKIHNERAFLEDRRADKEQSTENSEDGYPPLNWEELGINPDELADDMIDES